MISIVRNCYFLACFLFGLVCSAGLNAQTAVIQKCLNTTGTSFNNTGSTYNTVGSGITFLGFDFPSAAHRVVKIELEVTWSKATNCASPDGSAVDLSEVGFALRSAAGTTQVIAGSSTTGPSNSWSGTTETLNITTTFADNASSLLPAGLPINGTFAPNGSPLSAFNGEDPTGTWRLQVVDENGSGGSLCIDSYCLRIYTCVPGTLTASCNGSVSLPLDANGLLTLDFEDLDNGSDTSCMLDNITISPNNFDCNDRNGTFLVTMTLTDNLGSSANCSSNVTVIDNEGPVIDCSDVTLHLDAAGTVTYNANTELIATDNCGVLFRRINGATTESFGCVNVGNNAVVLEAEDADGNISACGATVIVIDTIPPVAICQDIDVYLDGTGTAVVTATNIDGGSTEVCPFTIASREIDGNPSKTYTCVDIGIHQDTLEVYDIRGNSNTCHAAVTVIDTFIPSCTTSLPIRLTSFNSLAQEDYTVIIAWQTMGEIDSDHFVLERSEDGLSFIPIYTVKAANNSNSLVNYNFVDDKLPLKNGLKGGDYYYRLKQVDINNQVDYSKLSVASFTSKKVELFNIYPNPTSSILNIEFTQENEGDSPGYTIFNSIGQVVLQGQINSEEDFYKTQIDVSSLIEGNYILELQMSLANFQQKFIKR